MIIDQFCFLASILHIEMKYFLSSSVWEEERRNHIFVILHQHSALFQRDEEEERRKEMAARMYSKELGEKWKSLYSFNGVIIGQLVLEFSISEQAILVRELMKIKEKQAHRSGPVSISFND